MTGPTIPAQPSIQGQLLSQAQCDQLVRAGAEALQRGDPAGARRIFEQVIASRPGDLATWVGQALACRDIGDEAGQLLALDRVLGLKPGHLPALLMKADHFEKIGDGRAAHAFYRSVVEHAPPLESLPLAVRSEVRRAERMSARYAASYEIHLRDTLAAAGFDERKSSSRFARSVDMLLGRKHVFLQAPTAYYFPELPHRQFYERSEFSWIAQLEAQTPVIREELMALVGEPHAFQPYVRSDSGRPPRSYGNLLDNADWGAFFLVKNGEELPEATARCPRTMLALRSTPLAQSPGRTPSILFSMLRPGTRIPPHTGYTNARLICHLPLIVPSGCGLRVGNDVREWVEGQALIFDDSIEHEAWNDGNELRVVLLFDIWRPELSTDEQSLIAATLGAVGTFGGDPVA